jgi:hypothetical protein
MFERIGGPFLGELRVLLEIWTLKEGKKVGLSLLGIEVIS